MACLRSPESKVGKDTVLQLRVWLQSAYCCCCSVAKSCPTLPPAFTYSQHWGLLQWVDSSHQVATVLELQFQLQSFQWIFKIDFLWDWLVWSPCTPRTLKRLLSSTTVQKYPFFSVSLFYGPTLTSIHDNWKNHIFNHTDLCQQSDVCAF